MNTPGAKRSYVLVCAAAALLVVAGSLLYSNTLGVPFVFDDEANIVENPYIRMTRISLPQITQIKNSPSPRPLANFSFALNYYFHQYRPTGYHLVNILIHIINALLVFLIAVQTLKLCRIEASLPVSLAAALLWLAHPLHTQSVTYIVQRMNALATMFYLLALLFYIRARIISSPEGSRVPVKILLFAGIIPAFILGMAAKPIVATLPLALWTYEWFFFREYDFFWLKKQVKWIVITSLILLPFVFIYFGDNPVERILHGYTRRDFTLLQRLLTQPRIVIFYISLLLFPHPARLNLTHDFSLSYSLLAPATTLLSIIAILVLLLAAAVTAKRHRLVSFAIFWWFGNLALESSAIGLELIFEHRTYLPSVFPVIAITALAARHIPWRRITAILIIVVTFFSGFWTYQRNIVWQNDLMLWRDCLAKSPENARPYSNIGFVNLAAGNPREAIIWLEQGIRLDPDDANSHNSLAAAYSRIGQLDKAIAHCRTALTLAPDLTKAQNTLGVIYMQKSRWEEAAVIFDKIFRTTPNNYELNMNMGLVRQKQGFPMQAATFFERAAKLAPQETEALYYLGTAQAMAGDGDKAAAAFNKILQIKPDDPAAHNALGNICLQTDKINEAIHHYQTALDIAPGYMAAGMNLAAALEATGDIATAAKLLRNMITANPDQPILYDKLGWIYARAGRNRKAADCFKTLSRYRPDDPGIPYNLACLYARMNNAEEAIAALKTAINMGYSDWQRIQNDDDLVNIRQHPAYQSLISHLEK